MAAVLDSHGDWRWPTGPDVRSFRLIARLGPGCRLNRRRRTRTASWTRFSRSTWQPIANVKTFRARAIVTPLDEVLTGRVRPVLGALAGAALLVLLVACGNVASLFVSRAFGRSHDASVRLALGARSWDLARGVLAESLVVALAAAAIGVWVGYGLVRVFVGVAAGVFPRLDA